MFLIVLPAVIPVTDRMCYSVLVPTVIGFVMLLRSSFIFFLTLIDFLLIRALMANHLITLDKSPGVRPIGVGKTLCWVIGKMC